MANASGFSEIIIVGPEDSFKNPPGTPLGFKLPVATPSFKPTVQRTKSDALTGSRQPRVPVDGKIELQGTFDLECNKTSLGYPLYGVMGAEQIQGVAGNYDHVFTLGTLGSWYVEQQFNDITQFMVYTGCRFSKADFTVSPDGIMKATFSLMGAVTAIQSSKFTADVNVTDKTQDLPFSYLPASLKYKGATIGYAQDVKVSIDNACESVKCIDSTNQLADIIAKIAIVSGSFTALFQDATILSDAIASSEVSIEVFVPSQTLGYGLKITIPSLKLMPTAPVTNGPGGLVTQQFTFDAYGASSTSAVAAFVGTKAFTKVVPVVATSDTLNIEFDNLVTIDTTLNSSGARTPTQIAADINAAIGASWGTTPLVNNVSGYTIGATSIAVDGLGTGSVYKSSFFTLDGNVYTVTADATITSNAATLLISPPLATSVADNDPLSLFQGVGKAFVENGRVIVQSSTKGSTSEVEILGSGDSMTLLGLPTAAYTGFSDQAIVFVLTNDDGAYA